MSATFGGTTDVLTGPSLTSGIRSVGAANATRQVLIIDDDVMMGSVLTRVLQSAGLSRIEAVQDAQRGVELFQRLAPDLVFLDLHMPGVDGFGVLEQLRQLYPEGIPAPIVMLTGDTSVPRRCRALELGARDFLLKPFDATEVVLRTRALLDTRRLEQALASQNRQLEARVAERTRELEASQLEMLKRLAVAAELRDDDTGLHTQRVGGLSGELALALGLSPAHAGMIALAAPLHDIGKIGIPDAILLKPGKLTTEEFALMRTHAATGARILSGGRSPLMCLAESIALRHHERWNGEGYPGGLTGSDIPIEARVVALADFFDALTHERPYRPAIPVNETIDMIRRLNGSHFDPEIVAAFLSLAARDGHSSIRHISTGHRVQGVTDV